MARGSTHRSPDYLLNRIHQQLEDYESIRDSGTLRELTRKIVEIQDDVRQLGRSVGIAAGLSPTSARDRIKEYFKAFAGEVIEGDELSAISGIAQYARRIRELREEGFIIRTGPDALGPSTGRPLRPDQYVYVQADQSDRAPRRI